MPTLTAPMATSSAPETAAPLTRPASGRKNKTAGCAGSIPAPPSGAVIHLEHLKLEGKEHLTALQPTET
jgi:hypothetical protein